MAVAAKRLVPADLDLRAYYKGTRPNGKRVKLWSYSYRTEPKKSAPLYWFSDCSRSLDEPPRYVSFTTRELGDCLELVDRESP